MGLSLLPKEGNRILLSSQSWGRELVFPEGHYRIAVSKPYALQPLLASVTIATPSRPAKTFTMGILSMLLGPLINIDLRGP